MHKSWKSYNDSDPDEIKSALKKKRNLQQAQDAAKMHHNLSKAELDKVLEEEASTIAFWECEFDHNSGYNQETLNAFQELESGGGETLSNKEFKELLYSEE